VQHCRYQRGFSGHSIHHTPPSALHFQPHNRFGLR